MLNDEGLKHIGYAKNRNRIWYVTETNHLLMEIDTEKQAIKCLCMIPGLLGKSEEYRMLGYYGNKLYILPFRSRYMYEYDLRDGKGDQFQLGQDKDVYATGCIYRDEYMYIYGWNAYLIKYHVADRTYCRLDLNTQVLGMDHVPEKWFWTDAFFIKDKIYLPMADENGVLMIDEKDRISYILLGERHREWRLNNIVVDDEKIHALYMDEDDQVHSSIFDHEGNLLEDADVLFHRDFEHYPYVRAYLCGSRWVLFPYESPGLCCVDESGGDAADMEKIEVRDGEEKRCLCTAVTGLDDGWLYAIDQSTGDVLSVNTSTLKTRRIQLSLIDESRNFLSELYQTNPVIFVMELEKFTELGDFIDVLVEET